MTGVAVRKNCASAGSYPIQKKKTHMAYVYIYIVYIIVYLYMYVSIYTRVYRIIHVYI